MVSSSSASRPDSSCRRHSPVGGSAIGATGRGASMFVAAARPPLANASARAAQREGSSARRRFFSSSSEGAGGSLGPGIPSGQGGGVFSGVGSDPRVVAEIAAGEFFEDFERAEADGEHRVAVEGNVLAGGRGIGGGEEGADFVALGGVGELGHHLDEGGDVVVAAFEGFVGVGVGGEGAREEEGEQEMEVGAQGFCWIG